MRVKITGADKYFHIIDSESKWSIRVMKPQQRKIE